MQRAALLLFATAALGLLAAPAGAEEYWIAYEGNDFPENEGWKRVFCDPNGVVGQGGAVRTLEDGALVLDSRESVMIVDFYNWSRPIDPDPGELFIMRWRLKVDEVSAREDPSVVAFSDDFRAVGFEFSESYVTSIFEAGVDIPFEPGVFHAFELSSWDMTDYELWIDGVLTQTGEFHDVFEASRVRWGDGVQGSASLARWDYFRFGVVPEPATAPAFMLALVARRIVR
jgi:hypothetical protein